MFRFFRQLRQRLLKKEKIREYLIYAFGEILLIVIGILIALQVNNLNEHNKQNELKQRYMKAIHKELKDDYETYERTLGIISDMEEGGRYVLPYLTDRQKPISDSLKFFTEFHNTYIFHASLPEPVIWKELQNSGNLNLFETEAVLGDLYEYYRLLEVIKASYNTNVKKFIDQGRYFDSSFFSREIQDDFVSDLNTTLHPGPIKMQLLREQEEPVHNINGMISGLMVSRVQLQNIKKFNAELRSLIMSLIN